MRHGMAGAWPGSWNAAAACQAHGSCPLAWVAGPTKLTTLRVPWSGATSPHGHGTPPPPGTCRELGARAWYVLYLTTADERGAGTDADVHIRLEGSQADTGRMLLPSGPEHFERGHRDKFR